MDQKTPMQRRVDSITEECLSAAEVARKAAAVVSSLLTSEGVRTGRCCWICGDMRNCGHREPELLRIHGLL